MKVPAKFKEYIWLVNTIRKYKRITFAEINEKWLETEMSEGVELARSTFNRHKDAIEDIFGIYIDCDRNNGYKYYIGNANVLHEDSVQNWMLSTLSVSNIISESMALKDRIKLESVPCDDYIEMVIEAMKKGVRIAVKYRKYGSDKFSNLNFEPYCLKMFMQRWYVLGHFFRAATPEKEGADYYGVFSFDRILEMEITDIPFVVKDEFDAQEYFSECMGVIAGDGTKVVKVVIRAFGEERYYLRDLPLHQSQKEIGQGEDFADFEYYIRPTIDFRMAIIARGCHVKVLEPESLIEEIRKEHKDALQLYEKK
ncbi:helix-turn-helix transcriptional regulator [Segatella bryantii]|jgi:hypothetical protein|uniref:helix-turn-helix transcriptional regulator n=1 Tax=Segatella bryantii TaxID=77095 RepID=UPI00242BD249|nr:WYL domain-containing protein [Segatella bryantii]